MAKFSNDKILGCMAAVLLVAAGASVKVFAASETEFEVRYKGIAHDALYDLCFHQNSGTAVGVAGTLFETGDGGKSWHPIAPVGSGALLGIDCDANSPIVVGQSGTILVRHEGNWQKAESGTDARLLNVSVNDAGLAFAVGGFGTVLRSADGGQSWEPLAFDWEALLGDFQEPHIYDVEVSDAGVVTIVGEFELILRSSDGGETWETMHRGDSSLFALELNDDDTGYAVGQEGKILRTEDAGNTWAMAPAGTNANLLDVLTDRDGAVHITGIRTLLRSQDKGKTWVPITAGDISSKWYQSLGAPGSGETDVFMVGHSGRIIQIK
jgi:photosystem II stability/assembly factor-like uncharacterized protein